MMRLDVKKGDPVIEVYASGWRGEQHVPSRVASVGPKWIRTNRGSRYQRDTGAGDFGWRLHTAETLADRDRRTSALRVLRAALDRPHQIPTDRLERAAAVLVLDEEA